MTNLERVQQLYGAFGRGDIPGILEHLDENVEWEYGMSETGVPWLEPRRGRSEVPKFFASMQAFDLTRFRPHTFLEGAGVVVVLIDVELTVKATGERIADEDEIHIWRFTPEGKIGKFAHKVDTHRHVLAYRGA